MSNNLWKKIARDLGFKNNDKITNLSIDPNKDKGVNRVKTPVLPLNTHQQADILYLPTDIHGYKYVLVVVDYRRHVELYPLKNLTSKDVLNGFKKIYEFSILKPPAIIQFDNGPEFKNEVTKFFKNKSHIKYTKPYRSRQNGLVESINFLIGKITGLYQNSKKSDFDLISILPLIETAYNNSQKDVKIDDKIKYPPCSGIACDLLKVGDRVRIPLEHPINPDTNELLPTKQFRSNDIRYSPRIYDIVNVILKPNTPPLYMVNQKYKVAYTRKQLIKVDNEIDDEIEEIPELPEDVFIIEKFVNKRKHKGLIQFLVKYKDYDVDHNLWQNRKFLINELGTTQFRQFEREFNNE